MPERSEAERLVEAVVFASSDPVPLRTLATMLPEDADLDQVLAAIRAHHEGGGIELVAAGQGVMFRTAPDLAQHLTRVVEVRRRLPRAAMETLAVIAYHQPITRAEIEEVRGVALSQATLDTLLQASLIAPRGHKEVPGRPSLWVTTQQFLAEFGLDHINALPRRNDLLVETGLASTAPSVPEAPEPDAAPAGEAPEPEAAPEEGPEAVPEEESQAQPATDDPSESEAPADEAPPKETP